MIFNAKLVFPMRQLNADSLYLSSAVTTESPPSDQWMPSPNTSTSQSGSAQSTIKREHFCHSTLQTSTHSLNPEQRQQNDS